MLAVVVAPVCAACASPLASATRSAVCGSCWAAIRPLPAPLCLRCGDPLSPGGDWVDSPPGGPGCPVDVAADAGNERGAGGNPRRQCPPGATAIPAGERECGSCRDGQSAVALARAIGEYEGTLRALLHALKYQGRRSIAPGLSALMRSHGGTVLAGADMVAPVPLHWRRRWQRGFNQAADLARGLGLPMRRVLRRCRHTPSQTDLPAGERRENVRRAFRVRRPAAVAGAVIVLVDDVRTTGATLEACARALRGAGAREVRALTAARVATTRPRARRR